MVRCQGWKAVSAGDSDDNSGFIFLTGLHRRLDSGMNSFCPLSISLGATQWIVQKLLSFSQWITWWRDLLFGVEINDQNEHVDSI